MLYCAMPISPGQTAVMMNEDRAYTYNKIFGVGLSCDDSARCRLFGQAVS